MKITYCMLVPVSLEANHIDIVRYCVVNCKSTVSRLYAACPEKPESIFILIHPDNDPPRRSAQPASVDFLNDLRFTRIINSNR